MGTFEGHRVRFVARMMTAATTNGDHCKRFPKRIIYLKNKIIDMRIKGKGYWEIVKEGSEI